MKVVQLDKLNLMDIPECLGNLKADLKSGKLAPAKEALVILVSQDGDISVYGFGEVRQVAHTVGLLHMAATKFTLE